MGVYFNRITGKHYQVPDEWGLDPVAPQEPSQDELYTNPVTGKTHLIPPQFRAPPARPAMPDPVAVDDPDEDVRWSDYFKSTMAGGASLVEGVGWMTERLGAEGLGNAIRNLGADAVDYWNEGLSDAARRELSKEFVRKNPDTGEWEWGDASLSTVGLMGAQSLLGTAAGMGTGAAAAKTLAGLSNVLGVFGNPMGRASLVAAVRAGQGAAKGSVAQTTAIAASKKLKALDAVTGAIGFGAGEGVVSALSAGVNIENQIMRLTPEEAGRSQRYRDIVASIGDDLTPDEAHQYALTALAREASSQGAAQTGLITGLLGQPMGAFFGGILGGHRVMANRVREFAMGAAGEAAQEFMQSGAEALVENDLLRQAGSDRDLWGGVLNQAVGGAAAGALMGGAFGASGAETQRQQKIQQQAKQQEDAAGTLADEVGKARDAAIAAGLAQSVADSVVTLNRADPLGAIAALNNLRAEVEGRATEEDTDAEASAAESAPAAAPAEEVQRRPDVGAETGTAPDETTEAELAGTPEGPAAEQRVARPRGPVGNRAEAVAPSGPPVPVEWELVEAGDLVVSHAPDGTPNPNYPQAFQPRDRSRVGSQQWLTETSSRLSPPLLVDDPSISGGAPIIGPDNVVESGNGRSNLLRMAYEKGTAGGYRDYLIENADRLGLTREQVEGMQNPVLVRRRVGDMSADEVAQFTIAANASTVADLSPAERARADANLLSEDDLKMFDAGEDGNILARSNDVFVRRFLGKLTPQERGGLMTQDGRLNSEGRDRIQAAVFEYAYRDPRLLDAMAEEADPDMKNVLGALTAAAPNFAAARAADPELGGLDLVTPLMDSIGILREAQSKRQSVEELLGQGGLFSEIPEEAGRMARFLAAMKRSPRKMREAFQSLGQRLESAIINQSTDDIFGGPGVSLSSLLEQTNADLTAAFEGRNIALFSRPGRRTHKTAEASNPNAIGEDQLDLFTPPEVAAPDPVDYMAPRVRNVTTGTLIWDKGRAIKNPEDLATLVAPIRLRGQEVLMAVVTDKNDQVLQVVRHTSGTLNESPLHGGILFGAIADIPGAENVWLAHNHPSGRSELSEADFSVNKDFDALTYGTIKVRGILAIGPAGNFSFEGPQGNVGVKEAEASMSAAFADESVPVTEREMEAPEPKSAQAQRRQYVRDLADRVRGDFEGLIDLRVVNTPAEIDGYNIPGDVEGVYLGERGEVYLVADNLPTDVRARQVLQHELLGHAAMERLPEFADLVQGLTGAIALGQDAGLMRLSREVEARQPGLSPVAHAKEVVALVAERQSPKPEGLLMRVRAAMRQFLERIGLAPAEITEAYLDLQIRRAFRAARSDAGFLRSNPEFMASQRAAELYASKMDQMLARSPDALDSASREAAGSLYSRMEPLSMDQAARLMRAQEQGFDTSRIYYHGTQADIDQLWEPDAYAVGGQGPYIYFTSNPQDASENYADVMGPDPQINYTETIDLAGDALRYVEGLEEERGEYGVIPVDLYGLNTYDGADKIFEGVAREVNVRREDLTVGDFMEWLDKWAVNQVYDVEYGDLSREEIALARYAANVTGSTLGAVYPVFLRGKIMRPDTIIFSMDYDEFESVAEDYGAVPGDEDSLEEARAAWEADKLAPLYDGLDRVLGAEQARSVRMYLYALHSIGDDQVTGAKLWSELQKGRLLLKRRDGSDPGYMSSAQAFSEIARGLGYDGATLLAGKMFPFMAAYRGGKAEHTVIFDRKNIRSVNAIFDPQHQDDARILYSRFYHGRPIVSDEIGALLDEVIQTPEDELPLKDRIRARVSRVLNADKDAQIQGLLDAAHSVRALEEGRFGDVLDASTGAYKAMLATRNLSSVMAAVFKAGVPDFIDGAFQPVQGRKGLMEILDPVAQHKAGNLIKYWELYAAARRADRLIGERNPDGTPREQLMLREDIDKALALGIQYPELQTAFDEYQQFNRDLLDLAEKMGVIDPEGRKIWEHNDYVPFYRAMAEAEDGFPTGPVNRRGFSAQDANPKRLWGSQEKLNSPLENIVMNTAYLLDASFRNNAMQRVAALAEGVAMERVPLRIKAYRFTNAELARALRSAGLIVGAQPGQGQPDAYALNVVEQMTQEQKESWSKVFGRVAPKGPDIVSVMVNGKPQYYRVTDPAILASLQDLRPESHGALMQLMGGTKRVLTEAITSLPGFMAANFVRDTLSTWTVTGFDGHPFINAVRGLRQAFAEDETMVRLMMAGAGGGGYYDTNPESVRKLLRQKMPAKDVDGFLASILTPAKNSYRFWRRVGAATENANRVAVHDAIIRSGGTFAEAAYQARDVLNFTMSGQYKAVQTIIRTVPFMNARMQGLYRLARGVNDNPQRFAMRGLILMGATMALMLANDDDDRYHELEDWERDIYWHFWAGDQHVRIPKPFEVGAIFATIPERIYRLARGDDSMRTFAERMWTMFTETMAMNPTPQLVKPLIEQWANKSFFTGNPIVGMAESRLQPEAQWTPYTSETARKIAESMPDFAPAWLRSPKRLEAFVRGYTSTLGIYVLSAMDNATREIYDLPDAPSTPLHRYPLIYRFLGPDVPHRTKYGEQLYQFLGESDALFSTINRLRDRGFIEEARDLEIGGQQKLAARGKLRGIQTEIRKINDAMTRIYVDRDMDGRDKYEELQRLQARKNDLLRNVKDVSEAFGR